MKFAKPGPASFCSRRPVRVAGFRRPHHRPSERTAPVALRERRASRERPFPRAPRVVVANLRSFLQVVAPVLPSEPSFPSIAAKYPVANWFEREVMDVFGLTPEGHPNPMRVALHDDWPEGCGPFARTFRAMPWCHAWQEIFTRSGRSPVKACFKYPWDPCMRGSSSPATFGLAWPVSLCCTFSSGSSTCIREPRSASNDCLASWSLPRPINLRRHRGWPLARTRTPSNVWRTSRACARTCAPGGVVELERLYNHTADIGALATDVAFTVPASRAQALREGLVRLQDQLFGTRLLRGTIALGGVNRDLPSAGVRRPSHAPAKVREAVRRTDLPAGGRRHLHRSR